METSVLCDRVSQASFIKLSSASLWFVLHFFFFLLWGNVQLGRYKAFHILRQWKGGRKTYRGVRGAEKKRELGEREMEKQGENDREWEEKEGKKQRQEKGGVWRPSCSSSPPSQTSPPSVSPQREKTTFCQVVSHHLFDLCWSYFIFIKNNSEEVL